MGSRKRASHAPQLRSRTTRSSKGVRLLADGTEKLTAQLRLLGLYAADTVGDGNCLFRALSDQLYGSPYKHEQLRQDVCDWISSHASRYAPFVEDERGLETHISCMRENGTYGGHMELSAFTHMTKRDVKVIQPGLVYVIEASECPPSTMDKERWRSEEEKGREDVQTVYVAYHDWEHFSSIRNLAGPHSGLPMVQEMTPEAGTQARPHVPDRDGRDRERRERKTHVGEQNQLGSATLPKLKLKLPPRVLQDIDISDAAHIPLPGSRSISPLAASANSLGSTSTEIPPFVQADTNDSDSSNSCIHSGRPTSHHASTSSPPACSLSHTFRNNRSPKRTFDESSVSGNEKVGEGGKRSRSGAEQWLAKEDHAGMEIDKSADTPGLSCGSSSGSRSASAAPSSSCSPSPPPSVPNKPLTRRQRKALGLPKARVTPMVGRRRGELGKIVIPGGKYRRQDVGGDAATNAGGRDMAEWRKNGNGRLDVRGFRELKI